MTIISIPMDKYNEFVSQLVADVTGSNMRYECDTLSDDGKQTPFAVLNHAGMHVDIEAALEKICTDDAVIRRALLAYRTRPRSEKSLAFNRLVDHKNLVAVLEECLGYALDDDAQRELSRRLIDCARRVAEQIQLAHQENAQRATKRKIDYLEWLADAGTLGADGSFIYPHLWQSAKKPRLESPVPPAPSSPPSVSFDSSLEGDQ